MRQCSAAREHSSGRQYALTGQPIDEFVTHRVFGQTERLAGDTCPVYAPDQIITCSALLRFLQRSQIRAIRLRTRAMKAARASAVARSRSYCARKNERTCRPHIGFNARINTLRPGLPAIRRATHHGEP